MVGEAEAFWLGWDLESAAVPLHHVVIADDALVDGSRGGLKHRSSAALAHVTAPFRHSTIIAIGSNSFWLKVNVSLFNGGAFSPGC
jgi:hypothetical protein